MPRKKRVIPTQEVKDFVVSKICEGHTLAAVCQKWPEKTCEVRHLYKEQVKDKDFAAAVDQAYTVLYMMRDEELERLSTGVATDHYPDVPFNVAEAALKRRIDTLKFSLGKMAPVMSKRFDRTQKVEVSGDNLAPQLAVVNYYVAEGNYVSDGNNVAEGKPQGKTIEHDGNTE